MTSKYIKPWCEDHEIYIGEVVVDMATDATLNINDISLNKLDSEFVEMARKTILNLR